MPEFEDDILYKVADAIRANLAHFGINVDEESGAAVVLDIARVAINTACAERDAARPLPTSMLRAPDFDGEPGRPA